MARMAAVALVFASIAGAAMAQGTTCNDPTVLPGNVCAPEGSQCIVPYPSPTDSGLIQLVQSLLTVNTGPGSAIPESCATIPCCKLPNGEQPACVNADVLGIIGLKLCVGGAVGNVVAGILPNGGLDIQADGFDGRKMLAIWCRFRET